ncbi:CaiB/BaiF CoA-transferase family protein [Arthrobacter sp. Marseille-P9274]|uniref:CaiB/BaiF CoA transferase family protein n=1 Tax=Arthrobacter sp. Marseille-P9274 TaxID=2866572 RepID=UPI0021C8E82B|nr:CoA transferase [Arthrobacter sp. Marseille-P9274]
MDQPKMETPRLLEGVRVVELGSMYAAPTAGRMLRDFGAEVIKVEDPVSGDMARQWQPQKDGLALGFARLNSGKRSVGIDLRQAAGREVALDLIRGADVVIESFRPGRLEAWGMGYDVLSKINPGLVLTRVSGFGQNGPYSGRPGFGTVAETASGYAFLNGWPDTPPTAPPFGFADSIAGISAAFGTAMALFRREVSGLGSEVDVALYEPLMFILGDALLNYTSTGTIMTRVGNTSGSASPRGIYKAGDGGWLSIAASAQTIAMRLFDAMGRPELKADERYATNAARMENNSTLQEIVKAWVESMPRNKVLDTLEDYEVVAAPVNDSSDIVQDPHFLERTLVNLSGTILGNAMMTGPILHVAGSAEPSYHGVPEVGEHTEAVLGDLGIDAGALRQLRADGVVTAAS